MDESKFSDYPSKEKGGFTIYFFENLSVSSSQKLCKHKIQIVKIVGQHHSILKDIALERIVATNSEKFLPLPLQKL